MRPPESWARARVTLALAALAIAVWAVVTMLGIVDLAALRGGFIPARIGLEGEISLAPVWLTPLTSAFLHGSFIHLVFNLLIHLFCGRPVENILGGPALLMLFVTGAYAAAAAQYAVDPAELAPMVGASGAVSAILGTYAMLFGRNRVKIANPTLALWVNALWLGAAWVALQLMVGFTFAAAGTMRIAIAAHIGGFLAGLLLARPLLLFRYRKA